MSTPVRNPENYCPICGAKLPPGSGHHCNGKTLAALDAARTRDDGQVRQPNEAERLQDGFGLVDHEYHEDNELVRVCPTSRHAVMLHWF